jgi:hypothetical protein
MVRWTRVHWNPCHNAKFRAARWEALKQGEIKQIHSARLVAGMEEQLPIGTSTPQHQLNADRSPVTLHAIAPTLQSAQRNRLVAGVQRQVEITMQARLPTN